MLNSNVLVLNRSYLPIHVTTVRRAFTLIFQGTALAVGHDYGTFDFESWMRQSMQRVEAIGTSRGPIRVPRVILLVRFDRVPKRHVRYSRINIFARDKLTCQYCGVKPHRSELNLDHVIPRTLGGRSTWTNVACSCIGCNRKQGGRTPVQAGMRLIRKPSRPRWSPVLSVVNGREGYPEWRPFLSIVDASYWNAELVER